jgi:hypothetical protein
MNEPAPARDFDCVIHAIEHVGSGVVVLKIDGASYYPFDVPLFLDRDVALEANCAFGKDDAEPQTITLHVQALEAQ